MKTISVFYTFSQDKDPLPNFYQLDNTFQNLDEFKIKHVLSAFPMPLDQKPYHIRFKTVCEEVEPKIMAWIDISNPNAKVPMVNNSVFMKILELPEFGLSKIYSKQKLQTFKNSQIANNQIQSLKQPVVQKIQERVQEANIQAAPPRQYYQQQQKVLDDLLGDSDDFQNQSTNQSGQFQKTSNQEEYDFSDFKPIQLQTNQINQETPQFSQSFIIKKNSDLNLLDEEDDIPNNDFKQSSTTQYNEDEPIDREKIKARNKEIVEGVVQGKLDELNKIWDDEEQYKTWRQEAKDQLEPVIVKWAFKDGSRNQIRNMLSLLHEILWDGADWKPCSFADLLNDGAVKRKYHDAIRIVHPDKNQFRDHKQRYISERVFFELNQSFNLHRKTSSQQQGIVN